MGNVVLPSHVHRILTSYGLLECKERPCLPGPGSSVVRAPGIVCPRRSWVQCPVRPSFEGHTIYPNQNHILPVCTTGCRWVTIHENLRMSDAGASSHQRCVHFQSRTCVVGSQATNTTFKTKQEAFAWWNCHPETDNNELMEDGEARQTWRWLAQNFWWTFPRWCSKCMSSQLHWENLNSGIKIN